MKKTITLFLMLVCLFVAFRRVSLSLFVVPENWPAPTYDFNKNPLTAEKIALGRALFHDPLISGNNTISCSSCHSPYTAFTHVDHALSHGIDDRIGTRNSPALMNLAWHKLFMWDGAINHLDMQSLAPISHPDEMGESLENVVIKLQTSKIYPRLFLKAYGDSLVTGEQTLKAIAQFMLTLVSCDSKYDSVMRQQSVFNTQEQNGYRLFKENCASCHTEPLFTNLEFKNNGLPLDTSLRDYGRMLVSQNPKDSLKFKVPTLRNIEFSNPYMHDGRFKRLSDVLKHYSSDIQTSPTLAKELETSPVLTSNERVDIVAFLLTLTDKHFLFNKDYSYPKHILMPK